MGTYTVPTIVVRGVGVQGAAGAAGVAEFRMTAATTIHAAHAVAIDDQGRAYHPDRDVPSDADRVMGVAAEDALAGEPVRVITLGPLAAGSWTEGPLYVDDDGSLTSTPPADRWQIQAAVASSPTELFVDIKPPIILAP